MTDSNIEAWRTERQTSVAGAQGDLALIGLHTILQPTSVEGIPGLWAPLTSGNPGLMLTASKMDQMTVDGQVVDGTIELKVDHSLVRISNTLTAMATTQPGSDHLLAVWDADCEAIQSFEGISAFPFDQEWVIEAQFVNSDAARTMAFTHSDDADGKLRFHQSPGDISFVKDGVTYNLTPFVSEDSLIVVFGDKSNGKTTYGMGRMLVVSPEANGTLVLDFNKSFLPPCAFSHHFNCPLPPAQNRLSFEVNAGEKQVLRRQ